MNNINIHTFANLPTDKWGFPILKEGHVLKNERTGKLNTVTEVEDNHLYTNGGRPADYTYGYYYHLKIEGTDKHITLTPAMIGNFNWEFIPQ